MASRALLAGVDIDPDLWRAIAGISIPGAGDNVYYIASRHAEHCSAPRNSAHFHTLPPPIPCRVISVRLLADSVLDQVYADFFLDPRPESPPPSPLPTPDNATQFLVSTKLLSKSDVNTSFYVPKDFTEKVIPPPDGKSKFIAMHDLGGNRWEMEQCWRKASGKRGAGVLTLKNGWREFARKKKLIEADRAVFVKRPDGEIYIGLHRTRKVQYMGEFLRLAETLSLMESNQPFNARFYPTVGSLNFIVAANIFEANSKVQSDERSSIPLVAGTPLISQRSGRGVNDPENPCMIPRRASPSRQHGNWIKISMYGRRIKRRICLTELDSYDTLCKRLEELFDVHGELCATSKKWQVAYKDDGHELMMVGDIPWLEFCNITKRIHIYKRKGAENPNHQAPQEEALPDARIQEDLLS